MQDIRQEIIRENLPKLIQQLTAFEISDDNFKRCEQFALYIIKNHRNLSVNSHEIKRKIEGMQEKFRVANLSPYADHLQQLCEELVKHPLCVMHYEVDVSWSVLEFLFNLAYNPVGALRKNKNQIDLNALKATDDEGGDKEDKYWKELLKEDFIDDCCNLDSDSDLSVWSDEEGESSSTDVKSILSNSTDDKTCKIKWPASWKPPQKDPHFEQFDGRKSREILNASVQRDWWNPTNKSLLAIPSQRTEANFAQLYNSFLSETSNNLIKRQVPSTESEHSLLKEIIWMFNSPQTCKFFKVVDNDVQVQENVSIPSLSVNGLRTYLEESFIPHIKMMNTLKKFIESVYVQTDSPSPITYECYAANLVDLLEPINSAILEADVSIQKPQSQVISTLIQLQFRLHKSMLLLKRIHNIHTQVVLDSNQSPSHILSAHLLAALLHINHNAQNPDEANLSMSLFLTTVKVFCQLIEAWWSDGRLDDWQNEFVVEKIGEGAEIKYRQFTKNREMAFFVPASVSTIITENSFIQLLLSHSEEAGSTLNLLYQINKISDLRNSLDIKGKLYDQFIEEVWTNIREFSISKSSSSSPSTSPIPIDEFERLNLDESSESRKTFECLATNDQFLLMAFACNLDELSKEPTEKSDNTTKEPPPALKIFNELSRISEIILPLEDIILTSMTRILNARIAYANQFVIKMYLEEFQVKKHFQNIRKVLLFECSDLMSYFYSKLFVQIESEESWANPFLLTVQLDDIMCSKFPELSSLFRVDIQSAFRSITPKVTEAVDEITIGYNISKELRYVITEKSLEEYNKVFRFLLKVKWGIWALENLHFPQSRKRTVPYAPFEMIDLIMRRLEQLRFWMIYSLQCIHFHLMTHVLQSMGQQLDEKFDKCSHIREMLRVHESYITTVCNHCFLGKSFNSIKVGVEQLLNLVYIIRMEWNSCLKEIDSKNMLSVGSLSDDEPDSSGNYVGVSQIDAIEVTYIRCHQFLANNLNNEVYLNQNNFLSGLSAAFNASIPY
ncbi:gamma-tubulin complex component 5 [Episyrphus balteatus]|uniref:gamma-tubulin complex component 5 n=1 Tax=Episyrphus balteatus TaxID=286459 RepID=UPI002486C2A6|nr:gamma-tubulin complex component 5 [Episyrphus balteatus]